MTQINERELAVLGILDGCLAGASEYDLVKFHAVALSTIYRLIERGLIRPEERTIWRTVWLQITEAGRAALKAQHTIERTHA
jgi:hypothetical protein